MKLRRYIPGPLLSMSRQVLDRLGAQRDAIDTSYDPYDRVAAQAHADKLFYDRESEQPLGTIGRSQLLLDIIEAGYPTQTLQDAYFANLDLLLGDRERLGAPGRVVIGLGSGRSGSTSLAALLATVEGACSTHENPPVIFWEPDQAQIEFHLRRFRLLREYYPLVADVSHWWLNALDTFFQHFPDSRAVGLIRDTDDCARSFMRIKGYGRGSMNHWAAHGSGIWVANAWDPAYPSYAVPADARDQPDRAKLDVIRRYVLEYNEQLTAVAQRLPDRVMLLGTDELSVPAAQKRLFDFLAVEGRIAKLKLNVRDVADGEHADFRF